MTTPTAPLPGPDEALTALQSAALADFARTCKAAARAVSLYPSTHPAIQSSLARLVTAAGRLAGGGDIDIEVHPAALVVDGRTAARPDPAIAELAAMLHERLVGSLHVGRAADAQDWLALLAVLGRAVEDVIAGGGIASAWAATGRQGFEIREIDYAEVLRERAGGEAADWQQILANCLQADTATISERAAALLRTLQERQPQDEAVMAALADAGPRMSDEMIAAFVAGGVVAERGATDRLAQAFQALVPDGERQMRLLDLAKEEAAQTPLGADGGFEDLWQSAASMLTSYSDRNYVSTQYGRELSSAREQAIEVDRVSDDPPDRVQAWLATVTDAAVRALDLALLQDLLRIEPDPDRWQAVAAVAMTEVERRTQRGELAEARQLIDALATRGDALDRLASATLVRHIVAYLRRTDEGDPEPLNLLCQAIGPRIARPLAEALAAEENSRVIRRLRELLLAFGAAGRQSVEQLKNSPNPAIRRMAIDLLRVFGGREALPELASMLGDADPQVQRESIRAIVQIGTNEAYAVLERALVAGGRSRETVIQELVGLRDDKAIPLLCYVLRHTAPRGNLVDVHVQIIEALGGLSDHRESTRTLGEVLRRGDWWAPSRTARLRNAAAAALRRIGSPDALRVLEQAAATGGRGVRAAARAHIGGAARRERVRS